MQQQAHSLNSQHENGIISFLLILSFIHLILGVTMYLGQQGWDATFELDILALFSQEEEIDLLAGNSSYLKWDT